MKRREFVWSVLAGSVASPALAAGAANNNDHGHHLPLFGPDANAVVSFGNWRTDTDPAHDRFPNVSDRFKNGHQLIPHIARIRAGGTVNFIIGGFHQVLVYGPGSKPSTINTGLLIVRPMLPPLIDDPVNRVYRGLDPATQSQDRVEVVGFANKGLYLVICGVLPHFTPDNMFGWVRVK